MSKKIMLSVLSIAVALAFAGIGTYALFSDTASSTGNEFTAGTMNLQVNGSEELDSLNFSNVYPGWTHTQTYKLHNEGNVQGALTADSTTATDDGGAHPSAEQVVDAANNGDLSDKVDVVVTVDGVEVFDGTLSEFVAADASDLGIMAGGDDRVVEATFSVDSAVGNEIMGDTVIFDLGFSLTSVPQG